MEVEKIYRKRFISVIQLCSTIATKNKTCHLSFSTIFRQSVLLVEETGENHRPAATY
jgi:hypothetical protein